MSKEPAEIFERAAEEGFILQLKHHSTVSQYGQLNGALALDGSAAREHFKNILYNQVGRPVHDSVGGIAHGGNRS